VTRQPSQRLKASGLNCDAPHSNVAFDHLDREIADMRAVVQLLDQAGHATGATASILPARACHVYIAVAPMLMPIAMMPVCSRNVLDAIRM
jgi:hypothetical protein